MPSTTLIVIAIALESSDPTVVGLERAAQTTLGPGASIEVETVPADPPDVEVAARATTAQGIIELTLSPDRARALLHCYLVSQKRWVDRHVAFQSSGEISEAEAAERGRLLGYAVATMFGGDSGAETAGASVRPRVAQEREPPPPPAQNTTRGTFAPSRRTSFEFAGTVSSGIGGTASSLGATAALRTELTQPLALRGFVAGRAGSIPEAQATTRTLELGAGLAFLLSPAQSRFLFGTRADALLSYFEAVHFSDDDVEPDDQARVLPGADVLAEAGFRVSEALSLYAGAGVEAMFGSTSVYTHGKRVALVPPFRGIAELGVRAGF